MLFMFLRWYYDTFSWMVNFVLAGMSDVSLSKAWKMQVKNPSFYAYFSFPNGLLLVCGNTCGLLEWSRIYGNPHLYSFLAKFHSFFWEGLSNLAWWHDQQNLQETANLQKQMIKRHISLKTKASFLSNKTKARHILFLSSGKGWKVVN